MTRLDRLHCCVPHCRRTKGWHVEAEWICGKHWSVLPAYLRQRKNGLFRLYRRRFGNSGFWEFPPGSDKRIEAIRLERMCAAAWRLCVRAAIERAVGI